MNPSHFLHHAYERLFAAFGPQHWWPGRDEEDVIIGAVLTQNTSWTNVERAMANLDAKGLCRLRAIASARRDRLARLLRPVGYFNLKADRLRSVARHFVERWDCDWERLRREPLGPLRHELLGVKGIGPETADSILLYALGHPTFVIDAYTKRILSRHGLVDGGVDYHALQDLFHKHLETDVPLFNEYHALLVRVGNRLCKRRPNCEECPLGERRMFTAEAWRELKSQR